MITIVCAETQHCGAGTVQWHGDIGNKVPIVSSHDTQRLRLCINRFPERGTRHCVRLPRLHVQKIRIWQHAAMAIYMVLVTYYATVHPQTQPITKYMLQTPAYTSLSLFRELGHMRNLRRSGFKE